MQWAMILDDVFWTYDIYIPHLVTDAKNVRIMLD